MIRDVALQQRLDKAIESMDALNNVALKNDIITRQLCKEGFIRWTKINKGRTDKYEVLKSAIDARNLGGRINYLESLQRKPDLNPKIYPINHPIKRTSTIWKYKGSMKEIILQVIAGLIITIIVWYIKSKY